MTTPLGGGDVEIRAEVGPLQRIQGYVYVNEYGLDGDEDLRSGTRVVVVDEEERFAGEVTQIVYRIKLDDFPEPPVRTAQESPEEKA